ncbi:phosphoglycerate dehydrogenase [Mesorhizobium sp. SARCC-RB16n]|uniref:2-hydroxyacid dehydrogenase n=1 Tax=Mesorhizobium sp. SARCC-RB16n TaxID=2116687 RepID=UPI00122F0ADC|nr:2-hydroxyacid dehydrogenase [Mesorhizobium sp. SARCC-RB16n]KAA3445817.1 phosphoglycerate dehydrogenase [Mesorhizobium sp. SARCC-RB16n]
MKILVGWHATDAELARFRTAVPGATVVGPRPEPHLSRFDLTLESISNDISDADCFVGWVMPDGALDIAKKLKLICWMHTGCDELDLARLKTLGVQVTNLRGANSIPVAEQAMAILLGLAKRLLFKHQAVVNGDPLRVFANETRSAMLNDRTVGIIGLGQIGSAIAKRAKAFDMKILGVRLHPELGAGVADEVFGIDKLHHVLAQSDYVVLSTPITKKTEAFIGAAEIAAMKHGVVLVNVARGNLIQEKPLYDALQAGKIFGYGADVWWNYKNAYPATYHFPAPSRTGIQRLPNVIASGDQAVNADGVLDGNIDRCVESLVQFSNNKPLTWKIDLDLGY